MLKQPYATFHDSLRANNIPIPNKEIREDHFTRWGKNKRYYAKKVNNGYIFGDWSTGLKSYWFDNQSINYKRGKNAK